MAGLVLHLGPLQYVHILDLNENTTRVEVGPRTLVLQGNESVVGEVRACVVVPPRHYCRISNPVIPKEGAGREFELRLGQYEYRFHDEPFPLYPGETLSGPIAPLPSVPSEHALHVRAEADITDDGTERVAGEEWHVRGPCVYRPRPFVNIIGRVDPVVLKRGEALHLKAMRPFRDGDVERVTGEEWLYHGAGAYLHNVHEEVMEVVQPLVLTETKAFQLRARIAHKDSTGVRRRAGDEWVVTVNEAREWIVDVTQELVKEVPLTTLSAMQYCVVINPVTIVDGHVTAALGQRQRREGPCAFFLQPGEVLEAGVCPIFVLEDDEALLLRAREAFIDTTPVVSSSLTSSSSSGGAEQGDGGGAAATPSQLSSKSSSSSSSKALPPLTATTTTTTPTSLPSTTTSTAKGGKDTKDTKTSKGASAFTPLPSSSATTTTTTTTSSSLPPSSSTTDTTTSTDGKGAEIKGVARKAGDVWLLPGPCQYVPPITVTVVERRRAIVLKDNDGVYIRSLKTGLVRMVLGPRRYLLAADEVLWAKEISAQTLEVLKNGGGLGDGDIRKLSYFESSIDDWASRPPHAVVMYRCPPGCALQIFNYKEQTSRVVLGPNMALLGPWEHFNVLSLSAGKPKVASALKSIPLMLGPDFISDRIQVETADHARLWVGYAVNYHFEYDANDEASLVRLFAVPDFTGFVVRQLASRIRTVVAQTAFDEFHRHSAAILRAAVFGTKEDGTPNESLTFAQNSLVVVDLDVQAIEPVDASMQELLMRSVQMAISISTRSIEETARQEAVLMEQAARGKLDLQILSSQQEAERARLHLCGLRALSAAVESCGVATAEAKARAESQLIEANTGIETARLRAAAARVAAESEMEALEGARAEELKYQREIARIDADKTRRMSQIEVEQFSRKVSALGREVIRAMATSGEETKLKMLAALGLSSTLITDGRTPVNLFGTADGLIGGGSFGAGGARGSAGTGGGGAASA